MCIPCLALRWQLLPIARGRAALQVAFNALIPCMLFTKVGATLAAQSDAALLVIPLVALAQARSPAATQVLGGMEPPLRCTTGTSLYAHQCPPKLPDCGGACPSAFRTHSKSFVPGAMPMGRSTACAGQCNQGKTLYLLLDGCMAVP